MRLTPKNANPTGETLPLRDWWRWYRQMTGASDWSLARWAFNAGRAYERSLDPQGERR